MHNAPTSRLFTGLLASVCLLGWCEAAQPVSTVATVHFANLAPEQVTKAAGILQARFAELQPSYLSTVTATASGKKVIVEFRGEAPDDEAIREYATQGVFRVHAIDTPLLFLVTDYDVQAVRARQDGDVVALALTVNESAGQRLKNHTSRNPGGILVTKWNGKEQSKSKISGVFSRQFQSTGMDRETAIRMMIMLRTGRLPAAPDKIEIVHPPGKPG